MIFNFESFVFKIFEIGSEDIKKKSRKTPYFELIESLDKDGDSLINFEEYLKYIPVPEPISDEKPVAEDSVKIVPMSDEDFEDEDENRNEFEQERGFYSKRNTFDLQ